MTQSENGIHELVLLPSLKAWRSPSGRLKLTQKFLDGVAEYARTWPGPVTSLVDVNAEEGSDMDQVETMAGDPETGLELRPQNIEALAARLARAKVVLAFLAPEEADTAALCHRLGVPIVFITEYTTRTQAQIVDATTPNPLRRLRRKLWIRQAERKRIQILEKYSAGLQCNGTPTYDIYKSHTPNPILFFDNRVRRAEIIDDKALDEKCDHLMRGEPLRLVFGGRMMAMKGVLDLPLVAQALDRLKVPYRLDIYGSGVLEDALRRKISETRLADRVALHPPMDFRSGWIPLLKREPDLFVCCHPQGDPSSTYSEVMSCGVPIVGYDNEAFTGVVRKSKAGRAVAMHDAAALAAQIADLHTDRKALCDMSRRGRDFAGTHCFEYTFDRRVAHLIQASRLPESIKASSRQQQPDI